MSLFTLTIHWRLKWQKILQLLMTSACQLVRNCTQIINIIKDTLVNDGFIKQHKINKTDFTRKRSLPFNTLFLFLLNLLRSSIQNELDKFFKNVNALDIPIREVTASAFCQARKKLNYTAFVELLHKCNDHFYKLFSPKYWRGFRLVAVDGSTIQLPKEKEIEEHFGAWHPRKSTESCPIARISHMFDVLNHIIIDAKISPKKNGERTLAAKHFEYLNTNDLVLLDRGYPAFWLFMLILSKGAQFVARLPIELWTNITNDFLASPLNQKIIELTPGYLAKKECEKLGLSTEPVVLRLVKIELDTGEIEILITSLIDCDHYNYNIFKDLYFKRWPIEEDYKLLKSRVEIANFTGKSVLAVKQDFYARIFMANLTSILAFPVHDQITKKHEKSKLKYKINWTQALAKMKESGILLFFRENIVNVISKLWELFVANDYAVRPGRKFPRKYNPNSRKFYFAYKPIS